MLADGGDVELRNKPQPTQDKLLIKATKTATATLKKITFAPKPNAIGKVVPIHFGKVSPLYKALRGISAPTRD
jgi:hypothetical protein